MAITRPTYLYMLTFTWSSQRQHISRRLQVCVWGGGEEGQMILAPPTHTHSFESGRGLIPYIQTPNG